MLREELRQLWKVERPKITATVNEAAKNGDRSENGDYIYGKQRLREIDGRVRYLSKRLETITVVDQAPTDQNRVYFGAWITLEDDSGQQNHYRIVGTDELNPALGYISIDSPLAKAVLGKALNDMIKYNPRQGMHGKSQENIMQQNEQGIIRKIVSVSYDLQLNE